MLTIVLALQGGLDSLGVKQVSANALTPVAGDRRTPRVKSCAARLNSLDAVGASSGAVEAPLHASGAASWGAFEDTPFSPARPACRSSVDSRSPEQLRAMRLGPFDPGATPHEAEDLAEQVRQQLQLLLAEKARLAQDNARLERENRNLQELLSVLTLSVAQPEDAPLGEDEEEEPAENARVAG